eukprot:CAMPEP_0178960396 /NCGR_PEP_ID=MMETSP0789-20121207/12938_1 /TAXON_ID=3005 /ORGANISM="Rhizosolenia setigera, Strain CCMP 1694" /LENGTH=99 /DNA_ID=CAMNT_0020643735 /DNA_START=67 /DNA_END=363 /DNA_ORIENTATION=+
MIARFFKFLFFAALFSLSDASGIKNRDEEPLKVRAKKHLSNLPNSNRKINPRSLNQKRDLQLSLGEMFGFKPKEEGVVSHSSSEISVSVDEDTVFFVAL